MNTQQNVQQSHEAELIACLCRADETALEQLYHLYYGRLFRFIARIAKRDDFIDEIINDVMMVVWEKAPTYDQKCKPSTWIFGIAFNKARQALRDEGYHETESMDEIDEDNALFGQVDNSFGQVEVNDWFDKALNLLSPDHRAVIELTYYENLHYSEIAIILNCPENTVKTRMFHARKNLAIYLKQVGETSYYAN